MKTILLLAICLCSFSVSAQTTYYIKGSVADTSAKIKLPNTSVSVLNSKDSTLVSFLWTRTDGSFVMNNLNTGKFILLVSYDGYADYVEQFSLDSINKTHDFGELKLILKTKLLQEVLIKAAAIKIKGDTTEFNARSYKIQPNDRVEDLIRQFPGIQVDQNGKITANGKPVGKVLVDGEEFFNDDPTLVTRNIRADMVDKVQLYDKKSDQAAFTGIDDGKKPTTTLNVTLREDSKNGYFGKADAGGASDEIYQSQVMYNLFRSDHKFSAYGTIGNTDRTGLSAQDNSKYNSYSGFGGGNLLESYSGTYNGEGRPSARTGGVHYDGKWDSKKKSINVNYKIGTIDLVSSKNLLSQNNLPGSAINSISNQNSDNTNFRHKVDFTYQDIPTPSTTFKISADAAMATSDTRTGYLLNSTRSNNILLNTQSRDVVNHADEKGLTFTALWTKKFKKLKRTMSVSASQVFTNTETSGYLLAKNNFYNTTGILDSARITDQYKPTKAAKAVFNGNITYSEPISKALAMVLNYGAIITNITTDNRSYDPLAPGQYTLLNKLYSNNFEHRQINNKAGAVFSYTKTKSNFALGARMTAVNDDQDDLKNGIKYSRNYVNVTPQVNYSYRSSQQRSFYFNYLGIIDQPSINQIQPIKENIDPLNITIGNPALKASFTHFISFSYSMAKAVSGQSLSISTQSNFIKNMIVGNNTIDAAGKSTLQYQNLSTKTVLYNIGSISLSKKLKKSDLSIGLDMNFSFLKNYSFLNSQLNATKSNSYTGSLSLSKYVVKKYDFNISLGSIGYSTNKTSLNSIPNNGLSARSSGRFNIYLPGKLQIGSDAVYIYKEAVNNFGEDFSSLIWNATLSKKFLKKESLILSLTGNDLLNQNVIFSRVTTNNYFSQSETATIKRYVMLSLTWDFVKMGTAAP